MEFLIPIALILVGLGLILVEVYLVPGFNVVGLFGFIVVLFAIGYVFSEAGILGGIYAIIGTAVAGGGLFYWVWTSGAWERFILVTSLSGGAGDADGESDNRSKYLGRTGVAITPLRPTGVVSIDGERIEVVTEGEFIASGSTVRVVAMDRRRFFVRLASMDEPAK